MSDSKYNSVKTTDEMKNGEITLQNDKMVSSENKQLDCQSERTKFSPSEVISQLGFGRAQIGFVCVFFSTTFSQFLLVNMMAYLSTRLYVELGLTAEMQSILSTASFAGFAICHLFWGWVADRFGRRTYALASSLWIAVLSLLCVVAPTYGWLLAFRLLYSLAGAATNILQPAMYELIPADYHWASFVVGNQWSGGASRSLPIIGAAVIFTKNSSEYDWRLYLLIMCIPALIHVVVVAFLMYETPRFLLSKGKTEDAIKVLGKIAIRNGRTLPKNLELIEDEELAKTAEENLSLCKKFKVALLNSHMRRSLAGYIFIGIAIRYFTITVHFLKTEMIFLNGQTQAHYCQGSEEQTYFLDSKDYIYLIVTQIVTDIISCSTLVFQNKLKMGLRALGLICYGISFIIMLFLFLCPSAWVAVAMVSVVQILTYNLTVSVMLTISGLLPTSIRSSAIGFCGFIIYAPLPLMPYAVQTLAKISMHYVTGLSLGVCCLAFVGSAILPTKIYSN